MAQKFRPMPPLDQLRFEEGDLVVRPPEVADAQAIFTLLTDDRLTFFPDSARPQRVEQLREGIPRLHLDADKEKKFRRILFTLELDGQPVGLLSVQLRPLGIDGRDTEPLLRTAEHAIYRSPDAGGRGLGRRAVALIEPLLVEHFEVELIIGRAMDNNEEAQRFLAAQGYEGPLHHDDELGHGFWRRAPRR